MTPERWQQIEALYQAALERPSEERSSFLAQACADDPGLREEVESLLAEHEEDPSFLEEPLVDLSSSLEDRHVGPYKLIRPIGRGGMGQVYLARRADESFRQSVAVKVIRRGLDTDDILRRFRAERQILAGLTHPHIARLLDGGATEEGLPYVVMEYVDGEPITAYCDTHRLTVNERLALFRQVCAAVHYAHQNLVVHRDLKPSNILVTADGTVKLLDFGIAKVLNPDLSGISVPMTRTELRMMTPEYASPEQVRGHSITTASDVYSLGVLLYELLTGRRPYRLPSRLQQEIERVICEEEPERPSTAVSQVETVEHETGSTTTITPEDVSQARGTQTDRLRRRLSGDLDTIVLMAMRKEPTRRYASVEQFSEDIRRHLGGLPVLAQPDTLAYRSRKFVQRHRVGVASAAIIALLLLGSTTGMALQSAQIRTKAEEVAQERDKATEISLFLVDLFKATDPLETRGDTVTARELLVRGTERIQALQDQPETQAEMLLVLSDVHRSLGTYSKAESLAHQSLQLRRHLYGEAHQDVAASLMRLGTLQHDQGQFEESEQYLQQALRIQEKLPGPVQSNLASIQNQLGRLFFSRGDYAQADSFYSRALATLVNLEDEAYRDRNYSLFLMNYATLKQELGEYEEAERLMKDALLRLRQHYGEVHAHIATCLNNLAVLKLRMGDYEEAESYLEEALATYRTMYGDEHPYIAATLNNLAGLAHVRGDYASAERRLRDVLALDRKLVGAEHPDVALDVNNLAQTLQYQAKYDEAEPFYQEALSLKEKIYGLHHVSVATTLGNLAGLYLDKGAYDTAERYARRALAVNLRVLEETSPDVAIAREKLAGVLLERKAYAEAETLYRQALGQYQNLYAEGHRRIAEAQVGLGRLLVATGRAGEAEQGLRAALQALREEYSDQDWRVATAQMALGACLSAQGQYGEAETLLTVGLAALEAARGSDYPLTRQTRIALIALYEAWKKPAQADQYRK